jgi:hypothetical protein
LKEKENYSEDSPPYAFDMHIFTINLESNAVIEMVRVNVGEAPISSMVLRGAIIFSITLYFTPNSFIRHICMFVLFK